MGKVFIILMIVVGVWIGMEVFTEGTDGAFGGIFATAGGSEPRVAAEPPVQRIRARVQRDLASGVARSTAGLGDPSTDEDSFDEE